MVMYLREFGQGKMFLINIRECLVADYMFTSLKMRGQTLMIKHEEFKYMLWDPIARKLIRNEE